MRVNLERVDVQEVNIEQPDPINIDVEMEEPLDEEPHDYSNMVRGRTIENIAALKLAKNILTYIGLGSEDKAKT